MTGVPGVLNFDLTTGHAIECAGGDISTTTDVILPNLMDIATGVPITGCITIGKCREYFNAMYSCSSGWCNTQEDGWFDVCDHLANSYFDGAGSYGEASQTGDPAADLITMQDYNKFMFGSPEFLGKTFIQMNNQGFNSANDMHSAWEDFCQPFNDLAYEYFTPTLKVHGDYMGTVFSTESLKA